MTIDLKLQWHQHCQTSERRQMLSSAPHLLFPELLLRLSLDLAPFCIIFLQSGCEMQGWEGLCHAYQVVCHELRQTGGAGPHGRNGGVWPRLTFPPAGMVPSPALQAVCSAASWKDHELLLWEKKRCDRELSFKRGLWEWFLSSWCSKYRWTYYHAWRWMHHTSVLFWTQLLK